MKHNPAVYDDDVQEINGVWDAEHPSQLCLANVLGTGDPEAPNDMSAFDDALASGDVPEFNHIVPHMCEDGHDTCPGPA